MTAPGTRKFWGWGVHGAGPSDEQVAGIQKTVEERFGRSLSRRAPPEIGDLDLPAPRVEPPAALAGLCSSAPDDRAGHHYGKSYRDIVRAYRGEFPHPPDHVARPTSEDEVAALLDWCADAHLTAVPYGGGSSVVGGVETGFDGDHRGVVSIDMERMGAVIEVDRTARAARIQAGAYGPALEDALRPHGLTLRHFPQSFEFSTLGGWIATRGGGHYATLYTHIDDFVASVRAVTPSGLYESRRLPGSGAGPSPDRMMLGSEGILGIVTEAWMRLQDRPTFRAGTSVRFEGEDGFLRGAEAVRAISQSGLFPANCRLLDAAEAQTSGAGDGTYAVLVLGFESADHPLDVWMARAAELCRDAGGIVPEGALATRASRPDSGGGDREGAAGAWRRAFLQAPYVRDALVGVSVIAETFETAIPWDRFPDFHRQVMAATHSAVLRVCGAGQVACRFTHVYPDGAAPYYSVLAPARPGSELEQWAEIKQAAADALIAAGGTITHHHAVGRDHRPWYDMQRPEPFARALRAAKAELDPAAVLNPGVLIDPEPRR